MIPPAKVWAFKDPSHKGLGRAVPQVSRVAWEAQRVVALEQALEPDLDLDLDLEPDLGLAVAVAVAASKAEVRSWRQSFKMTPCTSITRVWTGMPRPTLWVTVQNSSN